MYTFFLKMNQNLRFIQTAICPDRFVFQDRKLEKLKDLLRNLLYNNKYYEII